MKITIPASLSLAWLISTAAAQNSSQYAPIVEGNPHGVTYQAVLQEGKAVHGSITGVSAENGTGVHFYVSFSDFPGPALAPYAYHIHVSPINSSQSCASALGHLSPYGRADQPPCNATQPWTCQPGDLSGKHGAIAASNGSSTVGPYQHDYLDLYLSTDPNSVSFIGNRSVVVHSNNGTRLNCANFKRIERGSPYDTGNSTTTMTHQGTSTATATNVISSAAGTHTATGGAAGGSATATATGSSNPSTYTGAAAALSASNLGTGAFVAVIGKLLLAVL